MKFLAALFLTLTFVSCGESPLLNHELEKNGVTNNFFQTREDGYKFKKTKFSFSLDWIDGPVRGENKFILRSWNDDLGTLNGPYQNLPEKLHVYLWMPDMGHGSAPVKLKQLAPGEYEVSNVYIIMGGKWDLHFQLLKNEAVVDEVTIPLSL